MISRKKLFAIFFFFPLHVNPSGNPVLLGNKFAMDLKIDKNEHLRFSPSACLYSDKFMLSQPKTYYWLFAVTMYSVALFWLIVVGVCGIFYLVNIQSEASPRNVSRAKLVSGKKTWTKVLLF